jgi:hypothetical protein
MVDPATAVKIGKILGAQAFDGSVFLQCVRTSERIDPKDIEAIKKLPSDAILMGNIKELHSLGKLKVAMPIVRNLSVLIKKAKSAK